MKTRDTQSVGLSLPPLCEVLAEDARRRSLLARAAEYDPLAGVGSTGPRREVTVEGRRYFVPEEMLEGKECPSTLLAFERERCRHDFEFWCARCVTILDKQSGRLVKLVPNAAQRKLLAAMEAQRRSGRPIRIILLKARQWGGSTLVHTYMAWLQLLRRANWNSLVCGHVQQAGAAMRGMYSRLLSRYPKELLPDGVRPELKPFEGSANVRRLTCGDSLVILSSAQTQDAARGYDFKMAHLTEVAFWPSTPQCSPLDMMRTICGSVPMEPDTLVVLESTANGVGSFFHSEWLRAQAGNSDKEPIFVPWHEIEIYRRPVSDAAALCREMDDYERRLWHDGLTLEMINWYHFKRREYALPSQMQAEFPTNDVEAFVCSAQTVFRPEDLLPLRSGCRRAPWTGDIYSSLSARSLSELRLSQSAGGPLKVWLRPEPSARRNRYVAAVDIGGRSAGSDYSVIAVLDRGASPDDIPQVAAQWRGHTDHDLLAWKAAQLAKFYNNALLVVESNTLEAECSIDSASGDFLLATIARNYRNVYRRKSIDPRQNAPGRIGFQTNRSTKVAAINNLIAWVRDQRWIERDSEAVDEMSWYEVAPSGKTFAAKPGKHDDILMTRAIALAVIDQVEKTEPSEKPTPGDVM